VTTALSLVHFRTFQGRAPGRTLALGAPQVAVKSARQVSMFNWRLRSGRKSMLCAPILHSLGIDSLIRANNAIDGMTFEQLRTGIL
jgi:hypothetical protein